MLTKYEVEEEVKTNTQSQEKLTTSQEVFEHIRAEQEARLRAVVEGRVVVGTPVEVTVDWHYPEAESIPF